MERVKIGLKLLFRGSRFLVLDSYQKIMNNDIT